MGCSAFRLQVINLLNRPDQPSAPGGAPEGKKGLQVEVSSGGGDEANRCRAHDKQVTRKMLLLVWRRDQHQRRANKAKEDKRWGWQGKEEEH